jgi:tRNA pseudouridine38-40 synthase
MSQRYFIRFSYDGTNYHGWQIQPNGITVQEKMTAIMQRIFGPELELTGAGRTDSGVHAEMMYAHFDTDQIIEDTFAMAVKLNYMMPEDIAVHEILHVIPNAHARFDATSRTYEYRMFSGKNPFKRSFYTHYNGTLDVAAMNEAAGVLMEYTDFTSFSKLHTDVKTNECRIVKAFWEQRNGQLVFIIKADRFLRNMVRAVVGTLLEVGRGKMDTLGFRSVIEAKNRCNAGSSVDAKGLFLVGITYPESLFI